MKKEKETEKETGIEFMAEFHGARTLVDHTWTVTFNLQEGMGANVAALEAMRGYPLRVKVIAEGA